MMLDQRFVRNNSELVRKKLADRGFDVTLFDQYLEWDKERLELIEKTEKQKQIRNENSKKIGEAKRSGEDISSYMTEVEKANELIATYDEALKETIVPNCERLFFSFPNLQHDSVPVGIDETKNVELKKTGEIPIFDFTPLAHEDIGVALDIFDFERGAKVTGSRFVFYKGLGAKLERALISFMLDVQTDRHGYTELMPPYLVNHDSAFGTGQLPKFSEDMFHTNEGHYLISTAEIPVTNYHRDEILEFGDLPKNYCAYSACFRSEVGSAGRDTKGIIRQHQFNKVELVKLTKPEDSYAELENITRDAERILEALCLPYRRILLCTGDAGFGSAKTYDLEVWFPSQNKYREISSATNFEDFQGRRANIRFKRDKDGKPEYVHTLNASGLAVGRTLAAILENYQNEDGTVNIPEILIPYMNGKRQII